MLSAGITMPTQDGNSRTYSPEGYNTAKAAGGQRSSPNRVQYGRATASGYTPTYAKYGVLGYTPPQPENAPMPQAKANAPVSYNKGPNGNPLLGGYFDSMNGALQDSVNAYGDIAGQNFKTQIGTMLGNLNGIGALRSGGVQAGINQAMQTYGQQIGDYARMTSGQAMSDAITENNNDIERQFRAQQYADAKNAANKSAIGKLLGGAGKAIGLIPGMGTVGTAISDIFGGF
jgi:hypothetical protein